MKEKLERLSNRVWRTEKARFTASARSKKRHKALVFSISFLSIFQVLLAIAMLCGFNFSFLPASKSTYIAIVTSIIILVIANQDALSILLTQSESYHRCANKLHKLQQSIEIELAKDKIEEETVRRYASEYSNILEHHDLNHILSDYKKMASEYPDEFSLKKYHVFFYVMRYYFCIYWLPTLYCLTPLIVGLLSISVTGIQPQPSTPAP